MNETGFGNQPCSRTMTSFEQVHGARRHNPRHARRPGTARVGRITRWSKTRFFDTDQRSYGEHDLGD